MSSVTEISDTNEFQTTLTNAGKDKLVVIDFHAKWCGVCKTINPTFITLSNSYGNQSIFLKVDVDLSPEISTNYNIVGLPTFLFIKNGAEVARQEGGDPEALSSKIAELSSSSSSLFGGQGHSLNSNPPKTETPPNVSITQQVTDFFAGCNKPKPFAGTGMRLGELQSTSIAPESKTGWITSWFGIGSGGNNKSEVKASKSTESQDKMGVDENLPKTTVQIKLLDGTRLFVILNMAMPVSKIREFILSSRPEYGSFGSKSFNLMTGFPVQKIDETISIEQANLAHSIVIQRLS